MERVVGPVGKSLFELPVDTEPHQRRLLSAQGTLDPVIAGVAGPRRGLVVDQQVRVCCVRPPPLLSFAQATGKGHRPPLLDGRLSAFTSRGDCDERQARHRPGHAHGVDDAQHAFIQPAIPRLSAAELYAAAQSGPRAARSHSTGPSVAGSKFGAELAVRRSDDIDRGLARVPAQRGMQVDEAGSGGQNPARRFVCSTNCQNVIEALARRGPKACPGPQLGRPTHSDLRSRLEPDPNDRP